MAFLLDQRHHAFELWCRWEQNLPDFVVTATVTFRLLAVTVYLGEELHHQAGDTYNSNRHKGQHAICYFQRKKYVLPVMTRPVTLKAKRSKKKVYTRTFAVKVNTGDPATLHMFVVNLMD